MCGLVGAFARHGLVFADEPVPATLARMARRVSDGEGTWRAESAVLGHRRIAIIDLDPRAGQSDAGRRHPPAKDGFRHSGWGLAGPTEAWRPGRRQSRMGAESWDALR